MPDTTTPPTSQGERHGAGTYQMLWDCKFCGTEKLLGVTHRHCPNCGAAQDPTRRYFPAEEDMIALADHVYVGADRLCPACSQPNSAASKFCSECGADLSGGAEVAVQQTRMLGTGRAASDTRHDVVKAAFDAEMARIEDEAPEPAFLGLRRTYWLIAAGLALLALVIAGVVYAVTYRAETRAEVTGMAWERTIAVEVFGPVEGQNWRENVPGDAYGVTCDRRQRGTEKEQVGTREECQDVAQGDGTFRRECRNVPVYEDRPVYDRWCTYRVDRWEFSRSVKARGDGRDPSPAWPEAVLATGSGRYGAERVGSRHETYSVTLRGANGKHHTCDVNSLEDWLRYDVGTPVELELYLTGGADCDSLAIVE